jgi:hypothetical protein
MVLALDNLYLIHNKAQNLIEDWIKYTLNIISVYISCDIVRAHFDNLRYPSSRPISGMSGTPAIVSSKSVSPLGS